MQKIIYNFCNNCDSGLFLLDMPTGLGKTYSVLKFIAENYEKEKFKNKKFFFITTLKKNLPDEELRQHFKDIGKEDDYNKYYLRIEANADAVINKLDKLFQQKRIPTHITSTEEFKKLHHSVTTLNSYRKKLKVETEDTALINSLCKEIENRIRNEQERDFRKLIVDKLKDIKKDKILTKIENDKKYSWIGELYPAVFTKQKRFLFMSMDKFLLGNTTLIEPTYNFYENDITNNAIIFIDEFDATKDRMLNQIIERGLKNNIDYLDLFHQINFSLRTKDFPSDISRDILNKFSELFNESYTKFNMQYNFKTSEDNIDKKVRNFIFNDIQYHSVYSGKNSFSYIETENDKKQNLIFFTDKRLEDKINVVNLLSTVLGCLTFFKNGVRFLAENLKESKNSNKAISTDDYTFENAVETLLTEFHLTSEQKKYMKPLIMMSGIKSTGKINNSQDESLLNLSDRSVYDIGFRYYDFIDDPNHSMRSKIRLFDFNNTPEKILLQLSQKALVIGISATATLDTVLGNYDIEYLKKELNDKYYEMSEGDRKDLEEYFKDSTSKYDETRLIVESVSCNEEIETDLYEIFGDEKDYIKKYKEKLEKQFTDNIEYARDNFIRVIKVMKSFILNDNVKSFLCINNKLASENNATFNISLLKEFAKDIIELNNKSLVVDNLILSIDSENYERKREELINRLSNGEKIFVISSYNTIGAGQNLQYTIPKDVTTVQINDLEREDKKKDFDCIYLEKPTNLLVNVYYNEEMQTQNLIRYIYQVEFLMERGEIARKIGVEIIKGVFSPGIKNKSAELYKTKSVNNFGVRTLIQAVGRMCRTRNKNKEVFIYVDDNILNQYDFSMVKDRMLNPEFRELVNSSRKNKLENNEETICKNRATTAAIKSTQLINKLKSNWKNYQHRMDWKKLREICLKHPTLSEEDFQKHPVYKSMYIRAPRKIKSYSYQQEKDYNQDFIIEFNNDLTQKVSEEDARLADVMKITKVKKFFEENGYATEFKENDYILSPPMFNNIYKGALGEVIGKYIIDNTLGVNLEELPAEHFELFDYKVGKVYIDFKFWKGNIILDAEAEKKKIEDKLIKCDGERAIIINIMSDKYNQITTSNDKRIVEIPCLYIKGSEKIEENTIKEIVKEGYLNGNNNA